MPLDEELVGRARQYDRTAVEAVLTELFPAVHRMACALTGRADAGSAVERFVLKRAMRVLETWRDEAAPQRWFHHHTLLATRRARFRPAELKDDVLLAGASERGAADPAFAAVTRAMRGLPMRQREAL